MLTAYEKNVAPVRRPTMLLNAVLLPMLIKERITVIDSENMMAFSGMGVPIVTTLRNHPEKGRLPSLLNDQACRDAAARALRVVTLVRTSGSAAITVAAALLPVPA